MMTYLIVVNDNGELKTIDSEAVKTTADNMHEVLIRFIDAVLDERARMDELRTHCSVCGEVQFSTISGITCKNGHGGAPSVEE